MTADFPSEYVLPAAATERNLRTEARAIRELNAKLDKLPDDFPTHLVHHLTEIGERKVAALTEASRTRFLAKYFPNPETIAAECMAYKEANHWRGQEKRHWDSLLKQYEKFKRDGTAMSLPKEYNAAYLKRDLKLSDTAEVSAMTAQVPAVIDGIAPGSPISERQMIAHVRRAEKRWEESVARHTAAVEKASAPLNAGQTADLLRKLDDQVKEADEERRYLAGTVDSPAAETEYLRIYRYRAQVRTAAKKAQASGKPTFRAPSWRNYTDEDVLADIARLEIEKKRLRKQLDNLNVRFRREYRETGQYTQPQPPREIVPPTPRKTAKLKPKSGPKKRRTPEQFRQDMSQGPAAAYVQRIADRVWCSLLVWPTDELDTAEARRIMTLSNPDPENRPSFRPGDKFFTLQPSLPKHMHMDKHFRSDAEGITQPVFEQVHANAKADTLACGIQKGSIRRHKYGVTLPKQWRTFTDEILFHHLVQIPGSLRWVVSERHLDKVLARLAERNFPHRVIAFPGAPFFTNPNRSHQGADKDAGVLPVVRFVVPGVRPPRTGDGNHSLAGLCDYHLTDALEAGTATLLYRPAEEREAKNTEEAERHAVNAANQVEEGKLNRRPIRRTPAPKPKAEAERPVLTVAEALALPTPTLPPIAETSPE